MVSSNYSKAKKNKTHLSYFCPGLQDKEGIFNNSAFEKQHNVGTKTVFCEVGCPGGSPD